MNLIIEIEQEEDGRWIAEVLELHGVLAYGNNREEAIDRVKALSLRVLADRLENDEAVPTSTIYCFNLLILNSLLWRVWCGLYSYKHEVTIAGNRKSQYTISIKHYKRVFKILC